MCVGKLRLSNAGTDEWLSVILGARFGDSVAGEGKNLMA